MTDSGARDPIDVGDLVAARHHLGGCPTPTVRRCSTGIVILRTRNGTLHVAFTGGPTVALNPNDMTLAHPPT